MAVRVRRDGRILCAAMHPAEPGDSYIDDTKHYEMSIAGVLVTEAMFNPRGRGGHAKHGEWWLSTDVPTDVVLEAPPLDPVPRA